MVYTDDEIERLLNYSPSGEHNLDEDRMIIHENGDRSCFNWELRVNGFSLVKESYSKVEDNESLLKSLYDGAPQKIPRK
ncbi:MAG: hypothetical protein KC516_04625 [Nanoarchaeota archaeon]|nr:hypothetical protein [Nanoarchaeota archaeon]